MSRTYEQAAVKAVSSPDYVPNHGSADGVRDIWPMPTRVRRRCSCGRTRATHVGGNNAIALMSGCELHVRRWVKKGYDK